MSRLGRLPTLLALVASAVAPVAGPASAQDVMPPRRVAIGAVRTQGLGEGSRELTHQTLVQALADLGAEVPVQTLSMSLEDSCFESADCVYGASRSAQVEGLIDVRVIRVGPIVRIIIRVFDAKSGIKVLETESTAPAKSFPDPTLFAEDLARGLDQLQRLHTSQQDRPPGYAARARAGSPELSAGSSSSAAGAAGSEASAEEDAAGPMGMLSMGALGLGGLVFLGGAATGAWWLVLMNELDAACSSPQGCPPAEYQGTLDLFHATGFAAPALMGAGGLAAALGLAGMVMAPGE